jgi:hypothetical protein
MEKYDSDDYSSDEYEDIDEDYIDEDNIDEDNIDEDDIIELNLEDVKRAVGVMADNYDEQTTNIRPGHKLYDSYTYIKNISKHFNGIYSETLQVSNSYNNFINIIMQEFKPTEIKTGTLGSFIFGCFQSCYGDVDSSCSLLCNNDSIENPYEMGTDCKEQIIIQEYIDIKNGKSRFIRSKTSNTKSHRGYIYLNSNFKAFTKNEIEQFEEWGLMMLQGMTTRYSQHHTIFSMRTLDNVPQMDDINIYSSRSERRKMRGKQKNNKNSFTMDEVLEDVTNNAFEYTKTYLQSDSFMDILSYIFSFIVIIVIFIASMTMMGNGNRSNTRRIGL